MKGHPPGSADPRAASAPRRRARRIALAVAAAPLAYLLVAYIAMPWQWRRYVARHPWVDQVPRITYTSFDAPGDPLNIALVGTEPQLIAAMLAAQWYPADKLTLESCLRIAADTVLHRSYDDAPVSNLYLWGRREDMAFERPVGQDPRQRHHVRFWRTDRSAADGRPVWIGAATFDKGVGFSHTTGQITHHIAPHIDQERDGIIASLKQAQRVSSIEWIEDFHTQRSGRNGGGDPYTTDGRLVLGVIADTHPAHVSR